MDPISHHLVENSAHSNAWQLEGEAGGWRMDTDGRGHLVHALIPIIRVAGVIQSSCPPPNNGHSSYFRTGLAGPNHEAFLLEPGQAGVQYRTD